MSWECPGHLGGASAALLILCVGCAEEPSPAPTSSAVPLADPAPAAASEPEPERKPEPEPPPPLESPTQELPSPMFRDREYRRGVSLGLFVSAQDDSVRKPLYRQFLDEIVEVGATDIQLVVQWGQADVTATTIAPEPGLSSDDALLSWVVRQARKRKLRVFLMPIVHLLHRKKGHWRGKLSPTDWDAWWDSYRKFTLHYARLAERQRVHLYSVGSELVSTEAQTDRWRSLIAEVRKQFSGQLTYSANWDHFEPVGFWDALDVAGITGYQGLSNDKYPSEDALVEGWRGLGHRIDAWTRMTGQRFIFTEIGYPSQPFSARHPWDYRKRGEPDLQLQLRCFRALYIVWQDSPVLDGLYIWNWFGQGGPDDSGYTLRGKPARELLHYWYSDSQKRPSTGSGKLLRHRLEAGAESDELIEPNPLR